MNSGVQERPMSKVLFSIFCNDCLMVRNISHILSVRLLISDQNHFFQVSLLASSKSKLIRFSEQWVHTKQSTLLMCQNHSVFKLFYRTFPGHFQLLPYDRHVIASQDTKSFIGPTVWKLTALTAAECRTGYQGVQQVQHVAAIVTEIFQVKRIIDNKNSE